MAKSAIPNPLDRRHVVEQELPPSRALQIAEAYLTEDRVLESLDFLQRAGAEDRLAEIRARAIEAGDAFLLRAVVRAGGARVQAAEWEQLAARAEATGKERYAVDARRQAGREEG